jgi:starch-binding outer membrane protein, SusD/RagB family
MKNTIIKPLCLSALIVLGAGCTNLEVENLDSIVVETDGVFTGVNAADALNTSYNDMRGYATTQENLYALSEVTTDALVVPTRGVDWGDNGLWRSLHLQNWNPQHNFIIGSWNQLNSNVFRTNQILHPASNATASQAAQAKFLRAVNMFWIIDLWGQAPFREADEGVEVTPIVLDAATAVNNYILRDLEEALPELAATGPNAAQTLTATQAAAHFLLAKVYLNKHVFLGEASATNADMQKVVEHVDAITALGFAIEDDFFQIFNINERDNNRELIWWTDAGPAWRIWHGLHYNQIAPTFDGGGWNGFSTTADFYALFEGPADQPNAPGMGQEERRGFVPQNGIGFGFLQGQQYGMNGEALRDRSGAPLAFTTDFPGLSGNNERTGIRVIKYHPNWNTWDGYYVLFRYSDAHLMKAEAMARMGDMPGAMQLINELRNLRDATPMTTLSMQDILDERGREMYVEGWRRQDLIRFNAFTDEWSLKPATEEFRRLFPIPSLALTTNPNLVQNPGY